MKVLLLTNQHYANAYSELYVGIHKSIGSIDMRRLGTERRNLRQYFANHIDDAKKFDRIVFHLGFEVLQPQLRFLKELDNIIVLQTSTFLGDKTEQKNLKKYLNFFRRLPWARIILTSYQLATLFQREGLDAWCIPKGYNTIQYKDNDLDRNITLMLIRNVDEEFPSEFLELESALERHYPNLQIENNVIKQGATRLGESKMTVCVDFHRGEYSSKIFRAMACGSLVFAYNQGSDENLFHAFHDMENIVFFKDSNTLLNRIKQLRTKPKLVQKIAKNGQELAYEQHQDIQLGHKIADYIVTSLRKKNDYRLGISAFGFRW